MKIGILTWYDVLNYGSVFQAYALQEQIKLLGCSAVILRHDRRLPEYYGNNLSEISVRGFAKWFRNQTPNRARVRREVHLKYDIFASFRDEYLNVTDYYNDTDSDYVIIGSDQIFDINGMYFPFQFGGTVSCSNISTYAPCFGETTSEKLRESEHYQEILENIRRLKVVNARDSNTQSMLEDIRGESIPLVLDPTLLYTFEKEKKVWNKRLVESKYCVVYTWGGFSTSTDFALKCRKFASENNLKLVSVGERRSWCDIQFSAASPIEFFELFMYADMVLTNMFHGTCFSLLHNRSFYSFVMPHNKNKLGGLLEMLNLSGQMLMSPDGLENRSIPMMDYSKINGEIAKMREESKSTLRDMLK